MQTKRNALVGAFILVMFGACGDAAAASADGAPARPRGVLAATSAVQQTVAVKWLTDGSTIRGTRGLLTRRCNGVGVSVRTRALEPAETVDVFWAVFNNPAGCVHGNPLTGAPCGPPDLFVDEAAASLLLAATLTADDEGRLAYRFTLGVGDTSRCIPDLPCNDGLTNPLGAEIHSAMFGPDGGRQAAQFLPPR